MWLNPVQPMGYTSIHSGGSLTVNGENLPLHTTVSEVMIGRTDVTPSPKPITDGSGSVSVTFTVPQLQLGNQPISITIGDDNVITDSVKIITESADQGPSAPADAFAGLGDNLQVVWQYDNATSMWASYDPAELNDLSEVESGDIVWVEVTEDQEFQGQQLYAGWNLITLN